MAKYRITSLAASLAISLTVSSSPLRAETVSLGAHSRDEIRKACTDRENEVGSKNYSSWGLGPSDTGDYGCVATCKGGHCSVECEEGKPCTGSTPRNSIKAKHGMRSVINVLHSRRDK